MKKTATNKNKFLSKINNNFLISFVRSIHRFYSWWPRPFWRSPAIMCSPEIYRTSIVWDCIGSCRLPAAPSFSLASWAFLSTRIDGARTISHRGTGILACGPVCWWPAPCAAASLPNMPIKCDNMWHQSLSSPSIRRSALAPTYLHCSHSAWAWPPTGCMAMWQLASPMCLCYACFWSDSMCWWNPHSMWFNAWRNNQSRRSWIGFDNANDFVDFILFPQLVLKDKLIIYSSFDCIYYFK